MGGCEFSRRRKTGNALDLPSARLYSRGSGTTGWHKKPWSWKIGRCHDDRRTGDDTWRPKANVKWFNHFYLLYHCRIGSVTHLLSRTGCWCAVLFWNFNLNFLLWHFLGLAQPRCGLRYKTRSRAVLRCWWWEDLHQGLLTLLEHFSGIFFPPRYIDAGRKHHQGLEYLNMAIVQVTDNPAMAEASSLYASADSWSWLLDYLMVRKWKAD